MQLDPTTTEIIRNSLVYASEEMGIALRNSAYSPNIRERLDHSAAIFDDQGRLLAQAEHIPVHLGSLPWGLDRKSTRLNSSHSQISYAVFCLKKKTIDKKRNNNPDTLLS